MQVDDDAEAQVELNSSLGRQRMRVWREGGEMGGVGKG